MDNIKFQLEKIKVKYDLKREYFTLGIPVLFSILLILVLMSFGVVSFGNTGENVEEIAADEVDMEEYLGLLEALERGKDLSSIEEDAPVEEKVGQVGLDHLLILISLIVITPFSVDITLQKMKKKKHEALYTEFLFKLSEMMRGGLDPIKSVKELSKTDLGALTPHVVYAANAMSFGQSFETAMKDMARSLKSTLIARYTDLVIQASYSGGSVSDLILKCSEDMRSILSIETEKEGSLKQYVVIFYFAQAIIVFIIFTLQTSLLPFFSTADLSSMGGGSIQNIDFATGFFHLIILNAFFGGLVIGKISEGDTLHGLKHSVVLVVACYLAVMVFIVPPTTGEVAGNITINVVSGANQVGERGELMEKPIIVEIRDDDGKPVPEIPVNFRVTPAGWPDPESAITDEDGRAKSKILFGKKTGTHFVIVESGDEKVIFDMEVKP